MTPLKKSLSAALAAAALQVALAAALGTAFSTGDLTIEGGLAIISGLSAAALFNDKAPFSLNQVWWVFALVFLGITPAIQVAMHRTPWRNGDVLPATMLHANVAILTCLLLYAALRAMVRKRRRAIISMPVPPISFQPKRFYVAALLCIIGCALILLRLYGVSGLFLRSAAEARAQAQNTTLLLLGDKGARGVLLLLSLLGIHLYKAGRMPAPAAIILLGAVLVLAFPLAVPRYLAFTFYGAWLILFYKKWLARRRYFFRTALIGVLLLAAPLTAELRYIGTGEFTAHLAHPAAIAERTFLKSDFDAYASLCRAMQYTERAGTTRGRQLAGVALFFIPRKIWPQKPVGSGALMFSERPLDTEFTNVACTYLAEGWINFGWMGALLFTALVAIIIVRYDAQYAAGHPTYLNLFYPAAFGLLMFLLRGDLLSSFAYAAGFFMTGYITLRLLRKTGAA